MPVVLNNGNPENCCIGASLYVNKQIKKVRLLRRSRRSVPPRARAEVAQAEKKTSAGKK